MNHFLRFSKRLIPIEAGASVALAALLTATSASGSPNGPASVTTGGVVGTTSAHGSATANTVSSTHSLSVVTGGTRTVVGTGPSNSVHAARPFGPVAPAFNTPLSASHGYAVGTNQSVRVTPPATRPTRSGFTNATGLSTSNGLNDSAPRHPANAWTDPFSSGRAVGGPWSQRPSSGRTYRQDSTDYRQNTTGTILYPGAYGYRQNSPTGTPDSLNNIRARDGWRRHDWYDNDHAWNRYRHRSSYLPFFGGGYGYDGYLPYAGSFYETDSVSDSLLSNDSLSPLYSPAVSSEEETDSSPTAVRQPATEPTLPVPPPVGPQMSPDSAAQPSGTSGPDSLVEAVQTELTNRGYFGGKIDAIYGGDTRAAIQRFQADQGLPVTGRVNEATLHALRLD